MSVREKQLSKQGKKQPRRSAALKTRGVKREKDDIFGFVARRLEIVGDIESPMEDWAKWNPAKNLEK